MPNNNLEQQAEILFNVLTKHSQKTITSELNSYYKEKIEEVAHLRTKERQLESDQSSPEDAASTQKERTVDDLLDEEISALSDELSLYEETTASLQNEIAAIDEYLQDPKNLRDIKKIRLLKHSLARLNENLTKNKQTLKEKKKELEGANQKKIAIQNLRTLEKKQKKQLAGHRSADIDNLAVFLLPGKLLENYKQTLEERISSLETDLSKTRTQIKTIEQEVKSNAPVSKTKQRASQDVTAKQGTTTKTQSRSKVVRSNNTLPEKSTKPQPGKPPSILKNLLRTINSQSTEIKKDPLKVSPTTTPTVTGPQKKNEKSNRPSSSPSL